MLNLFQIGASDSCGGLLPIIKVIRRGVLRLIFILVPIGLILYGVIDLGNAVIASDEKQIKEAQSRLIKRFIYAGLVFFVPILVSALMDMVGEGATEDSDSDGTNGWASCWKQAR